MSWMLLLTSWLPKEREEGKGCLRGGGGERGGAEKCGTAEGDSARLVGEQCST